MDDKNENLVYYGEYSLKHWLDLMLKKNIELPPYQRLFVWDEDKVEALMQTFEDNFFYPSGYDRPAERSR